MNLVQYGPIIQTLAFSPTDPLLVTTGLYDSQIQLWGINTGKDLGVLTQNQEITNFAFNRQGILAYADSGAIYIWNLTTRTLLNTIPCESGSAIAWSFDDKTIAIGGSSVILVDSLTGKTQKQLEGAFPNGIMKIVWHPNGEILAAGGSLDDPQITVWDLTQASRKTFSAGLHGNTEAIVFITPDELIFLQDYGSVYSLNIKTNDLKIRFEAHKKSLEGANISIDCSCALSPNGQIVAYRQTTGVKKILGNGVIYEPVDGYPLEAVYLTNIDTGKDIAVLEGHAEPISHMVFSPDGKFLATSDFEGALFVWELTKFIGSPSASDAHPACP